MEKSPLLGRPTTFFHLALSASLLALVGCQTWPGAGSAAEPIGPWAVSTAGTSEPIAKLEIHETRQGLAGRATASDGKFYAVRNITASGSSLSFIVPVLDIEFKGNWGAEEKHWEGIAAASGIEMPMSLARAKPAEAAVTASPYAQPQRLVRLPDGRQTNLYCLGDGAPTVILDYGAGGTSADWSDVHSKIAAITRVCAYDRAGHGFSDPGPMPRDAAAVVADLRAMLKEARIPGPYVLVGHSLGSLHVRLFANLYFDDVAGMVLVDPSGDYQNAGIDAAVPKMAATRGNNDGLRRCIGLARASLMRKDSEAFRQCRQNDPDLMESRMSEADSMQTTSSEQTARSRRNYGNMPLVVLTRGDNAGAPPQMTQADIEAYYAVWTQMHDEFAALSNSGVRRVVPGATHYIQRDKPEVVVSAVSEVVTAARKRSGRQN